MWSSTCGGHIPLISLSHGSNWFLWRFQAACQLAKSSYFLFAVHIDRPLFIVPEDKTVITQLHDTAVAHAVGLHGPWFTPAQEPMELQNLPDSAKSQTGNNNIASTLKKLGCAIALDLGKLIVKNAYTKRPVSTQDACPPEETEEDRPRQGMSPELEALTFFRLKIANRTCSLIAANMTKTSFLFDAQTSNFSTNCVQPSSCKSKDFQPQ